MNEEMVSLSLAKDLPRALGDFPCIDPDDITRGDFDGDIDREGDILTGDTDDRGNGDFMGEVPPLGFADEPATGDES